MTSNWRSKYEKLTDFITKNPQIKISNELIEIPEEYRKEFYRMVDLTRSAFVEEEYPGFLDRARPLCMGYLEAEREIIENYDVFEVLISNPLRWFVNDPVDGIRRPLYNPLFELLRDRISIEQFHSLGRRSIHMLDDILEAQCYQLWLVLSLTNLLKPDRFFGIDLAVGKSSVSTVSVAQPSEYPVREPVEINKISLVFPEYNTFIVPQILVYSTRISRYVAIRAEPSQATWTVTNASENIEWRPIDRDTLLTPGLITINTSDNAEDLALVRDTRIIARPDLALICREPENWYEEEWFGGLDVSKEILDPRKGLYILSRHEVPQEITSKLEFQEVLNNLSDKEAAGSQPDQEAGNNKVDVQITNVGFDASKLDSFINMLA